MTGGMRISHPGGASRRQGDDAMLQLKPERFDLDEFRSQPLTICGKMLIADQSGALFWPAQRALIVADLDLGGDTAAPMPAGMRPQNDVSASLIGLAQVMDRYEPETVLVLGGNWEKGQEPDRLRRKDLKILAMMQEDRRWVWISGRARESGLPVPGGEVAGELTMDTLVFRQSPRPAPCTHEIAGSLRPEACVSIHGTLLRRPCFVGNGLRLLLPAFGARGGERNVLDEPVLGLLGTRGLSVWMLGEEGLYPIAARLLQGD
jgi:metallophosphoesterase superfamily enzyme